MGYTIIRPSGVERSGVRAEAKGLIGPWVHQ